MDILDRIFPALVLVVLDAVEDKTGGGHAERDTQAGHILAVGDGLVEVLAVDDIQEGIADTADHEKGAVGDKAEGLALFFDGNLFYFLIMNAHDIAARGVEHGGAPDGAYPPYVVLLYKNAVMANIGYPSLHPAVRHGLEADGETGKERFNRSVAFFYHDEVGGLRKGRERRKVEK